MKNLSIWQALALGSFMAIAAGVVTYVVCRAWEARNRAGRIRRRLFVPIASIDTGDILIKGEIDMLEIKEGQKVVATVSPKTGRGHKAAIEPGSGRWSTSDESIVSVEQDPANELSATVRGLDGTANESVVLEFRADGKVGEGEKEIIAVASVVCTAGDASVFELEFGSAVDDGDDVTATATGSTPATPANNAESVDTGGDKSGGERDPGSAGELGRGDNIGSDPSLGAPNPDGVPGDPVTTNPNVPGEGNRPAEPGDDFDQRPGDDSGPMTFAEAAAKAREQNDDADPGATLDDNADPGASKSNG